jgi:hypothetical protein
MKENNHLNKRITSSINKKEDPISLQTNKIKKSEDRNLKNVFHSGGG